MIRIEPTWIRGGDAFKVRVPFIFLQLTVAQGRPGWMGGVAGGTAPTLHFRVWVYLDGQEYACRLQADFVGNERILGRDVLNRLEMVFRGPVGELVVNP